MDKQWVENKNEELKREIEHDKILSVLLIWMRY